MAPPPGALVAPRAAAVKARLLHELGLQDWQPGGLQRMGSTEPSGERQQSQGGYGGGNDWIAGHILVSLFEDAPLLLPSNVVALIYVTQGA